MREEELVKLTTSITLPVRSLRKATEEGKSLLGKTECDGGSSAAVSLYVSVISAAKMWYHVH